MDVNVCPCKDCVAPKRHPGCHSHCIEYKKWSLLKQLYKIKEQKEKRAADDCFPNRYRNGKNRRN